MQEKWTFFIIENVIFLKINKKAKLNQSKTF